jgi:hypothetical protein
MTSDRYPAHSNAGKAWQQADLFFLKKSVEGGMPLEKAAGFLSRQVDEVREKARELGARPKKKPPQL